MKLRAAFEAHVLAFTGRDAEYHRIHETTGLAFALSCWDAAVAHTRADIVTALGAQLQCPCCGETLDCIASCTFAADCPKEAQQMQFLRDAVRP